MDIINELRNGPGYAVFKIENIKTFESLRKLFIKRIYSKNSLNNIDNLRKSLTNKKIRIKSKFSCSYDQQINCVFVHQMLIYCECHPTNNLLNKEVLGFLFFQRKNHF